MIPRNKNSRVKALWLAIILIATGSLSFMVGQPLWLFHWQEFRDGNRIVKSVESFRIAHGRLPNSLEELGAHASSDQLFYQKIDENNYEVWFSIALGESEMYDSRTKQWQ